MVSIPLYVGLINCSRVAALLPPTTKSLARRAIFHGLVTLGVQSYPKFAICKNGFSFQKNNCVFCLSLFKLQMPIGSVGTEGGHRR